MAYRLKDYKYNDKLTTEENVLLDHLYKLKMSHMAAELERQFLNPNSDLEDFHTRITALINYEWDQRQSAKFNKLLKKASLKYPAADFDKSIYEPDRQLDTHTIERLQDCKWIDDHRNLLITGPSGVGKTYLANAFCITALHQLRTVKYIRANVLIQQCNKIRQTGIILDYINQMSSYDLLVIDDFGLMDLDTEHCSDLFEILEARDSQKATIIASQFPVIKWWDMFKDSTYADACLSRATCKAYRLECNGRDMRQAE
jgi:DNA replication protein DnaC